MPVPRAGTMTTPRLTLLKPKKSVKFSTEARRYQVAICPAC